MDRLKRKMTLWMGLFLFGCATSGEVQILHNEIYGLRSQLSLIQKERESAKNELETLKIETNKIQRDISTLRADLNDELKKLQADWLLFLENLRSEVRILSTGVDEFKEFLKRPSKEIDRMREDIALRVKLLEEKGRNIEGKNKTQEDRINTLEDSLKGFEAKIDRIKLLEESLKGLEGRVNQIESTQMGFEKSLPAREAPLEAKRVLGAGDLYKDAFETFQKGDLKGARRKFEVFLKQYPNNELSDNAQFWIGETYYLKKDFEKAILEYEKAIAKYPEGDKIPAALLKQALSFLELGDKTNARNLFKRVIERYPHSEQADIAKKKLEGIT